MFSATPLSSETKRLNYWSVLSHQTQKPLKVGNLGFKQIFDSDFVSVWMPVCVCVCVCVPGQRPKHISYLNNQPCRKGCRVLKRRRTTMASQVRDAAHSTRQVASNWSLTIGQHWPDVLITHKDTTERPCLLGTYMLAKWHSKMTLCFTVGGTQETSPHTHTHTVMVNQVKWR